MRIVIPIALISTAVLFVSVNSPFRYYSKQTREEATHR